MNNARWYSTGVVLPDGEVFAVNGANRDEVVGPGTAKPVTQAELYDPATRQWHRAATETDGRTYHNTAVLLPDATVLVGGHAPIATAYAFQDDAGHDTLGLSKAESDPSFQVYRPPYLSWGLPRPEISSVSATSLANGGTVGISSPQAGSVTQAVLVRNSSLPTWWTAISAPSSYRSRVVPVRASKRRCPARRCCLPGPTCCSSSSRHRRACSPRCPDRSSSAASDRLALPLAQGRAKEAAVSTSSRPSSPSPSVRWEKSAGRIGPPTGRQKLTTSAVTVTSGGVGSSPGRTASSPPRRR